MQSAATFTRRPHALTWRNDEREWKLNRFRSEVVALVSRQFLSGSAVVLLKDLGTGMVSSRKRLMRLRARRKLVNGHVRDLSLWWCCHRSWAA